MDLKKEEKKVEIAAVYMRVSSTKQSKDGHGLDVQKEKCDLYAKLHNLKIIEYYIDAGVSGKKDIKNRPALNRFFSDIKEKKFEVLLIAGLDRLARDTRILLNIIHQLSTVEDIHLASVTDSIDTTTRQGELFLTILSGLASYDRGTIVDRLSSGKEFRRKNIDGDIGGKLPYGYVRIDKVTSIDISVAPIINRIYRLYLGEEKTMAEICRIFNGENIPTPNNKTWCSMFITKIVKKNRDKYMGGFRSKSKFRWPRLLEPDVVKLVKLEGRDDLLPSFEPQNIPPEQLKRRKYYRDPPPPKSDE